VYFTIQDTFFWFFGKGFEKQMKLKLEILGSFLFCVSQYKLHSFWFFGKVFEKTDEIKFGDNGI
jgi:hypothetical protein